MSYNASFVSALKEALNGLKTVHQVGEEWVSYVGDIPTGGVPYCGQEVNRSTYSALWEYANAKGLVKPESEWQSLYASQGGNVAYYSSGNGSSTFRMPRLVGYVRGASSQSESGSYVKEGLPNISGRVDLGRGISSGSSNGAFYQEPVSVGSSGTGSVASSEISIFMDAANSNAIYGNSSHVTPETSVVLYGVYAFGEVSNVDALDAGTLASALARVESNVVKPARYVTEKWSSGTSWYTKYSDGWVEQGGWVDITSCNQNGTVTFPVAFVDTNYTVVTTGGRKDGNGNGEMHLCNKTNTNFTYHMTSGSSYWANYAQWYACGY